MNDICESIVVAIVGATIIYGVVWAVSLNTYILLVFLCLLGALLIYSIAWWILYGET